MRPPAEKGACSGVGRCRNRACVAGDNSIIMSIRVMNNIIELRFRVRLRRTGLCGEVSDWVLISVLSFDPSYRLLTIPTLASLPPPVIFCLSPVLVSLLTLVAEVPIQDSEAKPSIMHTSHRYHSMMYRLSGYCTCVCDQRDSVERDSVGDDLYAQRVAQQSNKKGRYSIVS